MNAIQRHLKGELTSYKTQTTTITKYAPFRGLLNIYKTRGMVNSWVLAAVSLVWVCLSAYVFLRLVPRYYTHNVPWEIWLIGGGFAAGAIYFWFELLLKEKTPIYDTEKRSNMGLPIWLALMVIVFGITYLAPVYRKHLNLQWPPATDWVYYTLFGVCILLTFVFFFMVRLWKRQTRKMAEALGTYRSGW